MSDAVIDWIVLIPDHENALEKRLKARPSADIPTVLVVAFLTDDHSSHLEGLTPRIDTGMWVMGGRDSTTMPDSKDQRRC